MKAVTVHFAMSHLWSHTSQHSTRTTPHMVLQTLHCTLPFAFQSLKRLRKREDTSSPWHTCPTPLHLVEGMSLHPSSDHMGWKLSLIPSLLHVLCGTQWNNFIHFMQCNIMDLVHMPTLLYPLHACQLIELSCGLKCTWNTIYIYNNIHYWVTILLYT